jgi:hypothetical protein
LRRWPRAGQYRAEEGGSVRAGCCRRVWLIGELANVGARASGASSRSAAAAAPTRRAQRAGSDCPDGVVVQVLVVALSS